MYRMWRSDWTFPRLPETKVGQTGFYIEQYFSFISLYYKYLFFKVRMVFMFFNNCDVNNFQWGYTTFKCFNIMSSRSEPNCMNGKIILLSTKCHWYIYMGGWRRLQRLKWKFQATWHSILWKTILAILSQRCKNCTKDVKMCLKLVALFVLWAKMSWFRYYYKCFTFFTLVLSLGRTVISFLTYPIDTYHISLQSFSTTLGF